MAGPVRAALIVLLFGSITAPARGQDTTAATLRTMIATARLPASRWPDFGREVDDVTRLYASRADAPLWLDGGRLGRPAHEAIVKLSAAGEHGLDPRDYDASTLDTLARRLTATSLPAAELAGFDLLLTVAMARYLGDLTTGRLRGAPFGQARAAQPAIPAALSRALRGDSVARLVDASAPRLTQYRNLQRLLSRFRRLAADSTLPNVRAPRVIQPGDAYSGVGNLRVRLRATGDLVAGNDTSAVYGANDADAVRGFQRRHALTPDGVLGPATLTALNTPFAHRVRQIELALERLRWLPPLDATRFLVVNIPAFELFAFDSAGGQGAPKLFMKVVVGKALDTRTPLLFEQMRYVEFRPYWNVPRSILVREILPILRRNHSYLRAHDMEVVGPGDSVIGDAIDTSVLSRLSTGELRVRQRPGPKNAMGPVKFVFPNAESVYLHGTPEPELFYRERRDFSHGCIRVEDPAALAAWVLRDRPGWGRAEVDAAMQGATRRRVLLTRPIPVAIYYTTAVAFPDGSVRFYPDVYGLDRALDEAMRSVETAP